MKLIEENWFWCNLCECISYNFQCSCHGSYCNCGGCDKCLPLRNLVKEAIKNNNHIPVGFLKEKEKYESEQIEKGTLKYEPFIVYIPNESKLGWVEKIEIRILLHWDGEIKEWIVTPEAHAVIDNLKSNRLEYYENLKK